MGIADELITRGRARGVVQDDDGRVCLVGAANLAAGRAPGALDQSLLPSVRDALKTAIESLDVPCARSLADGRPIIWAFNDSTSDDDVIVRVAKIADEILDA